MTFSPVYKMFLNKPGFGAGFASGAYGSDPWKPADKAERSFCDFGKFYRLNENKRTSILLKAQEAVTG